MSRFAFSAVRATPGRTILTLCAAITAFTALVPLIRAFFRAEVINNEGWNIYFAMRAAAHQPLYPEKYGWTTDNYPALSFFLMAWLHRLTHDYLFTARAVSLLSLLAIAAFAGRIVSLLSRNRRAGLLAGLFCVAIFCANANSYVGADEPQMLAQVFVMAGLCVAVATGGSSPGLVGAALLFTIGGFTKHNLIDFPIAVLLATALQSVRRAALFAISGIAFTAFAIWLNIRFGGPHFLDELLLPRSYSWLKAAEQTGIFIGPVLLPFLVAVWMAWTLLPDSRLRVVAFQFAGALVFGFYFSGGAGVSINAFFSLLMGMSILLGLIFAGVERSPERSRQRLRAAWHPVTLFAWLLIPMIISGNWNVRGTLRTIEAAQVHFDRNVTLLRSLPGPALCESPLLCEEAGKPYIYDAFNATRLIELGKLDQQPMLDALRERRIAAVELDGPIEDPFRRDRFSPQMLAAIQQQYIPAVRDDDATIYLPRTSGLATPAVKP